MKTDLNEPGGRAGDGLTSHSSGGRRKHGFLRKHRATLFVTGLFVLIISFAVFLIVMFILTTGGTRYFSEPGSPTVYERIEALTDCGKLQRELDTAVRSLERSQPGELANRISLSYIDFAENRMQEIGCSNQSPADE